MLSDLIQLLTDTVQRPNANEYDIFGKPIADEFETFPARVLITDGQSVGPASRQPVPDAAATVWLVDHPHTINAGDAFKLTTGATLKAARIERRVHPDGILHKVYLK